MATTLDRQPVRVRVARGVSLLAAIAASGLILAYPVAFAGASHSALMSMMWGIAACFTHGVGYVPANRVNRVLLGPAAGWPALLIGTWLVWG